MLQPQPHIKLFISNLAVPELKPKRKCKKSAVISRCFQGPLIFIKIEEFWAVHRAVSRRYFIKDQAGCNEDNHNTEADAHLNP